MLIHASENEKGGGGPTNDGSTNKCDEFSRNNIQYGNQYGPFSFEKVDTPCP
jgi:hypothetical protein